MKIFAFSICTLMFCANLSACTGDDEKDMNTGGGNNTGDTELPELKLVWEENFDGSTLDQSVWNIELVKNPQNQEMQEYKAENIAIGKEPVSSNNCLVITARKEDTGSRFFTSGRLNTMKKVAFRYGRVDAAIKLPQTANGLWPAFWMKGNDNDVAQWPSCGEIDILEMGHANGIAGGTQDRYLGVACHWGPNNAGHKSTGKKANMPYSLQDDKFHVYSIVWDGERIEFYVDLDENPDQAPYYVFNYDADKSDAARYFRKEFYLLLNLAVGGNYTGITGTENVGNITGLNEANGYEAKMYVDYIRIYQRGVSGEKLITPSR